ncbi:G-protein alpha subunit-domain-containing protein [Mycena olivaceomarginata]|nr:G-protein alpha subunit-domain-containing protein [Mycena olivaceomarginata]
MQADYNARKCAAFHGNKGKASILGTSGGSAASTPNSSAAFEDGEVPEEPPATPSDAGGPSGLGGASSNDFSDAITALWNHSTVQEARQQGRETALQENLPYLYTNLSGFFSPSFIPTHRDILHLHERTIGTTETTLIVNGIDTLVVDIRDIDRRRNSECRKWIDAFADLTVIIYTISLTGYSCFLVEDPCRNQMQDSLLIWDLICNAGWFRRIPLILCFTKNDFSILMSQIGSLISRLHLVTRPPDGTSFFLRKRFSILMSQIGSVVSKAAPGDTAAGRDYFINRFLALVKIGRRVLDEDLNIRVITATDTDAETMKEVLDLAGSVVRASRDATLR